MGCLLQVRRGCKGSDYWAEMSGREGRNNHGVYRVQGKCVASTVPLDLKGKEREGPEPLNVVK